jgi:hypothetical protein
VYHVEREEKRDTQPRFLHRDALQRVHRLGSSSHSTDPAPARTAASGFSIATPPASVSWPTFRREGLDPLADLGRRRRGGEPCRGAQQDHRRQDEA